MPYGLFNNDDYTGSDTEDEICDEIEDYENDDDEYIECIHNKYYIGSYYLIEENNKYNEKSDILLFAQKIKLKTFYEFANCDISTYIYLCSGLHFEKKPNIDIMQLIIGDDGTYTAIIKTFWIKIIQRTWKKIMKQKKQNDAKIKRQIFSFSNKFQTTTRIHTYKGIKGMLS
jgi:hypothetical protein